MSLVTHSFDLDITPGAIPRIVNVSEYDENREYTVTLRKDGVTWAAPSGTTATIEGTLAGQPFSVEATVSGNTVTFSLDESMTAYAGDAWTKIKLTKDGKPVQTCAFILRCDKAGVEADTILNLPGFQAQINEGVATWLESHQPFFTLPEGGEAGQALLSDGNGGAVWGQAQIGSGLTDDVKQALLDCFENVAWINDQGQTYYDALYAALYPPANLSFVSAVFTQGSAVIFNTDSLDKLRQYLVVTAHYSDSSTGTVTDYVLSGSLNVGTSTITVTYGGKTATFQVAVTESQYMYTLTESDFFRSNTPSGNTPNYMDANTKRICYPEFDLYLSGGRTYKVTVTSTYDTAMVAAQFHNQTFLDRVNSGQSLSNSDFLANIQDTGWQSLTFTYTPPASVNGSDVVGVRFTFKQAANSPVISNDFAITGLTIEEVK